MDKDIERYTKTVKKWSDKQLFYGICLTLPDSPDTLAMIFELLRRKKLK